MINYSYYPFLPKAKIGIKELDTQAILYCEKHIEKYVPTNLQALDIPVWLISAIILRNLENHLLTRKFVSNYGKLFEGFIFKDIMIMDVRKEILDYFNIKREITFHHEKIERKVITFVKIHIDDYLEFYINLSTDESKKRFELGMQNIEKGFVYIDKQSFSYLMRLVLENKLLYKIRSMDKYTENDLINEVVDKLSDLYPKPQKRVHVMDGERKLPLSIQQIIDKAYTEHNLSHSERIKIGIYLQAEEYPEDFIMDIFRQLSDFSEKTTRYQLNSLKRYIR